MSSDFFADALPDLMEEKAKAREREGEAKAPRLVEPVELFREFLAKKRTVIATPLAGLTKVLGGGYESGRNVTIASQAGSGKTAFAIQSAAQAVIHGDFFAVLALKDGDMWADGMRLAQMAGVDRFALRDRDPEAIEAAREAMFRYQGRMMFYDVTRRGATFSDMAERARAWLDGRGRLAIVTDSAHVMPVTDPAKEAAMPLYERIGYRLATIHDFLVAEDAIGFTVGQSGRASYGKRRDEDNADPLTAVSGGHSAENTTDVLLVLTKPNADGTRFIVVPKSRLGGQGSKVPARYDEQRSLWLDAEPVDEPEEETPRPSRAAARQSAREEAERRRREGLALWLRRNEEGGSAAGIARAIGRPRNWVADVLSEFHAKGWVESVEVTRKDGAGREMPVAVWRWRTPGGDE